MTTNRARWSALMIIAAMPFMDEPAAAQANPPTPQSKWSLCGSGTYDLVAGGKSLGRETFEVACKPDGRYSANGRHAARRRRNGN